jgi:hypothetical protein
MLDANVLLADPMCEGKVWRVLAHAPAAWNLRVIVPEVALAEAIGKYGLFFEVAMDDFQKATKGWTRLGLGSVAGDASSAAHAVLAEYDIHLRNSLAAANVEVLPPPDVPHMQVVARSVSRRRPCDDNGDGYRDTLNWLKVLELAAAEDQEIVWVSRDGDFSDETGTGLHGDLLEDLAAIGASERVRLVKDLWAAVLQLAAQYSSDASDMTALRDELQDQTVLNYLSAFLSEGAAQIHLVARECGLPLETKGVVVEALDDVQELSYEVKGGVAQGEAVAGFTLTAEVSMRVAIPLDAARNAAPDDVLLTSDDGATVRLRKRLVFRGVLQLGRYDRPLGAEITNIEAMPDDPGVALWRLAARQGQSWKTIAQMLDQPNAFRQATAQSDAIRKMLDQSNVFRQATAPSDAIRKMLDQSNVFRQATAQSDAIRKMLDQWNVFKNLGGLTAIQDVLRRIESPPDATDEGPADEADQSPDDEPANDEGANGSDETEDGDSPPSPS